MRLIFLILTLLCLLNQKVFAENSEKKKLKKESDINFEDQLITGKYAYPDEAVTTVEDDKNLDDLLGLRKDFRDRIQVSRGQY